ncbi:ABC transporter ATP-binding protein [Marinobacterium arenosum]|uniref:ABC transporter ATP-binding protein n=1 Tax=Marinobacterium arenosum TaxID=2862496 RepID=UPI001C938344|nr:ABC transporter ATP-binding protein [Marinobacterium arenosum]MBY4675112.1 ABC transporter ATP-binding protein [Marinobacterium arenosum]
MIELQQLDKTYLLGGKPLHALDQVDLSIEAGEYIAITGPSGSGKSTLLNMVGLLDRPDQGRYLLNGQATEQLTEEQRAALRRAHIGFIFQAFHLIPRLSCYENIELPLLLAERSRAERRQRVDRVLAQVGLAKQAGQRPNQLSGGQMQRVAIARAIVLQPALLLADEPTGNLDQKSGREVIELLEALNRDGMTLLLVTHDPTLSDRARRRLQMVDGRIVSDTTL